MAWGASATSTRSPQASRTPRLRIGLQRGLGPASISDVATVARNLASRTARPAASGCQYMSYKRTVPLRTISRQASPAPQ